MASQGPRIYTYKITFEEVPYYYYGVHKEKRFNEEYWGSPKTHKWCWELYTPKKQILEFFEFSDDGWLDAQKVEKRLINPVYNTDKWCLNASCGGLVSLEILRKNYEMGIGLGSMSLERRTEISKKNGKASYERGVGVHGFTKERRVEIGKKGGKITKELGLGIHGRTKEQRVKDARKAGKIGGSKSGKIMKELGLGIHGRTKEQIKKDSNLGGKRASSQKWLCLETGHITNAAALTRYQKARGIDTSKRIRIS